MDLTKHISRFKTRFEELEQELSAPDLYSDQNRAQTLLREHSKLKKAIASSNQFTDLEEKIQENQEIITAAEDEELTALAEEELPELKEQLETCRTAIIEAIVPSDPNESRNIIVEIRGGAGGDEACIFAGDLYRLYTRLSERSGWKIDLMDTSVSDAGGYKEVTFALSGEEVYKQMMFESGVHRVQRVPATESQGRIHTSTATVAVLPEAQEVDIEIRPDDIRVDICRASGPGGQGVNTTDSAVQILHIETGMIVKCQDGRSQIKNKEKAMSVLRSRLLKHKQDEEAAKYAAHRKSQVGTGERNEKIRTYNYPQNRVTDHRINYSSHNLPDFMDGNIAEMVVALQADDLEAKLASVEDL